MIFKWLKKLFGLYDSSPTEISVNGELKQSVLKSHCDELDKREESVKQKSDKLKQSPTDWYSLNIPSPKDEVQTRVFSPRIFENIPSFQALKDERLRKEAHELKVREEKERIENKKRITEEQSRKLQGANRLTEEARKKEQAELAEKKRLEVLATERKENWSDFKRILDNNGIRYLYHFTDRRNISSIKRYGGLFSWQYCDVHGITIPSPGGIGLGRDLDLRYGLEDYVRLSFCREHPMKYIAMKDGRIQNPVVLLIDVEVAYLKETLFSDMNATKTGHKIGGTLNEIRFDVVKLPNHFDLEEPEKSFYQAEILVKTFVPKRYIVNLDIF